jgi:fructose-bisphosphate aldolase, class II
VHGVYKPGNVKLQPVLLKKHQEYVKEKINAKEDKPVFLVFHGGSGSSVDDFREAISYGVVRLPSVVVGIVFAVDEQRS